MAGQNCGGHPGGDRACSDRGVGQWRGKQLDHSPCHGKWLGLAIVDFMYVARRVISPIYLADTVVELGFLAWWVISIAVN